jgi:uncharacterized phage-associated protein
MTQKPVSGFAEESQSEFHVEAVPSGAVSGAWLKGSLEGSTMANVFDVAACILAKKGEMTAWKLQKLVYYAQAWSLVWDQRPLFAGRIEAWANGPVSPDLYNVLRGLFMVKSIQGGRPDALDDDARETVDAVVDYYGGMHPQELSDLTHAEGPWQNARGDLPLGVACENEITHAAMAEYYEALPPAA